MHLASCLPALAEAQRAAPLVGGWPAGHLRPLPHPDRTHSPTRRGHAVARQVARLLPRQPAACPARAGPAPRMAEADGVTIMLDAQPASMARSG